MALYHRWQEENIRESLKASRVSLLVGPRQCGKTTLAKQVVEDDSTYLTLDDPTLLAAALSDPLAFVQHGHSVLVIDQVQRAPLLLLAIKKVVDENQRPGQFILTGSSDIQSLPTSQESLAGRVRKIHLRPFTQGELRSSHPTFLERCFSQSFVRKAYEGSRDEILEMIFLGGYPESQNLSPKNRRIWHLEYVNALLDRDFRDIIRITQRTTAQELVFAAAAWSSKILDMSSLVSHVGASRPTVESYFQALELTFLVERVPAWTRTDYGRIARRPKIMMTDSGLMCSLLNLSIDKTRFDPDRLGKLVETFVFHELRTQLDIYPGEYSLFHFRDRESHEIDYLITREGGTGEKVDFVGIEVKASTTVGVNDFKNLKWFQKHFSIESSFVGIVLYAGSQVVPFGPHLWAIPISTFWET